MGKTSAPIDDVVCTNCLSQFKGERQTTFLGFPRYSCPQCQEKVVYPLIGSTFGCYLAIIIVVGLIMLIALLNGRIAIPGLLCIAGIIALINNARIKKTVAEAKMRARNVRPENRQ